MSEVAGYVTVVGTNVKRRVSINATEIDSCTVTRKGPKNRCQGNNNILGNQLRALSTETT